MVMGLTICLGHADAVCQCERYNWDDLNKVVRNTDGARRYQINMDLRCHREKCPKQTEESAGFLPKQSLFLFFLILGKRRRTVKTAIETVASMKQYEDLYLKSGGASEAFLDLQAKISRVITLALMELKLGRLLNQQCRYKGQVNNMRVKVMY